MDSAPKCSECLWCSDTQFMQRHLCQYLKSFDTKTGAIKWIEQAIHSLSRCMDCVEVYHQLVEEAFNIDPQFKAKRSYFLELVNRSNTVRLRESFSCVLDNITTDCATGSEDDEQQYSQLSQYRSHTLDCPIRELIKFPKLLMSQELNEKLAAAIEHLEEIDQLPQINDKYPGVYLLLVHPNHKVCSWAVHIVKSLGSLDWDDYDEIEEVINWIMAVISFNLFLNDEDCADIAEQRKNQTILPKHLFVHRSPKEFWIGICMLIKAMDGGCIRSRLMSVNGHRELVDAVLLNLTINADKNYTTRVDVGRGTHSTPTIQSASTTVFWPAMQCYSVLLDKLGSRFWQHTFKDASVVLSDIFSNPYYCFELTQWAALNSGDEDMEDSTSHDSDSELMTNSQIVQDWKPSLRPQEVIQLTQTVMDELEYEAEEESTHSDTSHKKSRTSVFSWMSPFINSILDFGDGSFPNIEYLMQVAHVIFVGAMLGKNHFEFFRDGKWCAVLNTTASLSVTPARAYDILSYSAFANEAFLSQISIVDLLLTKGIFTPLIHNQSSWLDDVTLGAKALIHNVCSSDVKMAHPTSLQQLSRVMIEFMTTKYARDDTELSELLSYLKSSALTKQCAPAGMGRRISLEKSLEKFVAGNILRDKLIAIVKHCESSALDDFQTSKGTSNSSNYGQVTSQPAVEAPIFPKLESEPMPDSDGDQTPDLLSDNETDTKPPSRNNVQQNNYQHMTCDIKTSTKDGAAESSTDDCESPQFLKGLNRFTSSSEVRDSTKNSTHLAVSREHNMSLSKAALSRRRGLGTEKKLTQTTLVAQDSQLSASSEVRSASDRRQLGSSRKVSYLHDSFSSNAKEVQSVQVPVKEKCFANEITSSNMEGTVTFAIKPLNLPKHDELQCKPTNQQVIMILSDSEEVYEEPIDSTSNVTVVQPVSNFNIGFNETHIPSAESKGLQHSHDQSTVSHAGAKLYSLDSTESMYEGLSELRKMVDPYHSAQRHVIDLRDRDESSPPQSTGDSDDEGIPLMEQFANVRKVTAEQSGDTGKQAMSDSDSDDTPMQLYRSCHKKPSFLSLSEETSESEEGDYSSLVLAAEKATMNQKFYCVPVASGTHEAGKPAVQVKDCKVVVHKCCSVQEGNTSSLDKDSEKMSPSPMDISDSSIPDCNIQKDDKLSYCVITDTDASLPAGVSYVTENMSPCVMAVSGSNRSSPLHRTNLSEPSSTDGKATEQGKKKLLQDIENSEHPPMQRQSENQCHAGYTNSVQSRSTILSPTVSGTANLLHSHTSLPGKQMPVATVSPMGFLTSAPSHHTTWNTEHSPEPPKRKQLLPAPKVRSDRRKVPTFESCQAQFMPGSFKNPNDYKCALGRNTDLLSTIMASSSSNSKQTFKGTASVPGVKVLPATSAVNISVNRAVTKPKVLFRMNDFHTRVLSWDPQWFLYPQESEDRQLICPSPAWFPADLTVPLVFQSVDQYCQVFSPLLLIEVWEEVYSGTQGKSMQVPPPCAMKVEAVSAADHPLLQIIKCKTRISYDLGKQYAHPVQQHLVRVELKQQHEGVHLFAFVDSYTRIEQHPPPADRDPPSPTGMSPGSYYELTLCLRVCKLDSAVSSSLENHEITCTVVTSLADYVRKWNGLVNLHTSPLAANILSPLGGVYFCGGKQQAPEALRNDVLQMLGDQYNDSQKSAVLAAVHATQTGFVHPRICLLQGPPGTGKTHTIIGLIRCLFRMLRSQQPSGCSLPGQRFGGLPQTAPHILLCAPSNTAVDEVVKRLIKKGHVRNTHEWRERYKEQLLSNGEHTTLPGFSVIRIGQGPKIDSAVIPVSLDELAKKDLRDVPQLDQLSANIRKEISVLEKEVELLENELHRAKKNNTGKSQVISLEQALNQKQEKKKNLIMQHKNERTKQRNSHREKSIVQKRLLMNADIVCSTLCGSGNSVMECFLRNPLHFSCVIVDEASQCCELDLLIPLRYKSSKLILIGDPLQLPATVKSQTAQEHGLGQSLFERLYKHFSQLNAEDNPVKMLQIQYRMLPQICQFPSQHFYEGKLLSSSDIKTAFPFKPFLVFDVTIGHEESKDEGSIFNTSEATLVTKLCKVLLRNIKCSQIGVITPYKAQERLIRTQLKDMLDCQEIDVGTVDGYQGKEKDVTILSCVRAKNTSGSIGFLWSRQRMNVSLTRGKKALYILCHVESLKVSPDWNALIQSAVDRSSLVLVNNNNFGIIAQDIVKPQPPAKRTSSSDPSERTSSAKDRNGGSGALLLPREACKSGIGESVTVKRTASDSASATKVRSLGGNEGGDPVKVEPCGVARDPRDPSKYMGGQSTCTAVVNPLPRRTSDPSKANLDATGTVSRTSVRQHGGTYAGTRSEGKFDTDQRRGSDSYLDRAKREADEEMSGHGAKKAKLGGQQKTGENSSSSEAMCGGRSTTEYGRDSAGTSSSHNALLTQNLGDIGWRPHGGERPRKAYANAAVVPRRQLPAIESSIVPKRRLSAREEIERRANRKTRRPGS